MVMVDYSGLKPIPVASIIGPILPPIEPIKESYNDFCSAQKCANDQLKETGKELNRIQWVGPKGSLNGPFDALRHCTVMCKIVKHCPPLSRTVRWLHEWNKDIVPREYEMDRHNNIEGEDCANKVPGRYKSCIDCCLDKLYNNKLIVLPEDQWDRRQFF
jgi:hypothetical protein